jgi:hypothetical protein
MIQEASVHVEKLEEKKDNIQRRDSKAERCSFAAFLPGWPELGFNKPRMDARVGIQRNHQRTRMDAKGLGIRKTLVRVRACPFAVSRGWLEARI